ncbi:CMRF35-like molecule 1 isoform X4 [Paroedura picta]|uniref:CMRF35-like molecule 1 isoform X4 n=1 Tax=Paroedura picta TaxID=143630 RepID=UPI0040572770
MLWLQLMGSVGFSVLLGLTAKLRGPNITYGFVGKSLPVMCSYDNGYQSYNKYWCKGAIWKYCTIVIKTEGSETAVKDGRTSIKDNQTCSCFTVTLENLGEEDAGVYWCAIEKSGYDLHTKVTVVPELLPPTTTAAVTTGYFSTVPNDTKGPSEITTRLLLLIVLLVLVVVLLVGGLLVMWRLKKQKAAKASGCTLQPMVPRRAEGNVSNATMAANIKPNGKKPSPSSDPDLNNTLHVEYASVKNSAPPTQPQVPSTNTEDVSYATIKFPTQGEQEIYANLKYTSNPS